MSEGKPPVPTKLVNRREHLVPGIGWKPLHEFFRRAWPELLQTLKNNRSNSPSERHISLPRQLRCCSNIADTIDDASLFAIVVQNVTTSRPPLHWRRECRPFYPAGLLCGIAENPIVASTFHWQASSTFRLQKRSKENRGKARSYKRGVSLFQMEDSGLEGRHINSYFGTGYLSCRSCKSIQLTMWVRVRSTASRQRKRFSSLFICDRHAHPERRVRIRNAFVARRHPSQNVKLFREVLSRAPLPTDGTLVDSRPVYQRGLAREFESAHKRDAGISTHQRIMESTALTLGADQRFSKMMFSHGPAIR